MLDFRVPFSLIIAFANLVFYVLSGSVILQAQSDLLSDSNVAWVAEVYTDYPISIESLPDTYTSDEPWATYVVEKMLQQPTASGFAKGYDTPMAYWQYILAVMIGHESVGYKSADLQEHADAAFYAKRLHLLDTVYQYDPATLEERLVVVRQSFNPEGIVALRVHHLLYWKPQEGLLGYRMLAFAPLYVDYDDRGVVAGIHPIAWFSAEEAQDLTELRASPNISLIIEAKQECQNIDLQMMQILKGEFDVANLVTATLHRPTSKLYSVDGSFDLIEEKQRAEWLHGVVDTVKIYDPVSYETTTRIVNTPPLAAVVDRFRLVTRWYWDSRNLRLLYEPVGYAPVIQQQTSREHSYYVPVMYIKH